MYFCANVSYASLPVYLPTILKGMGYSSINAQGLSAPPYFVAFLFALITTYLADKTQQRGLVLIVTSLVGGIGYIVLATVKTVGVRYFATFLASAGVFSTIPNILAWTISTFFSTISSVAECRSKQILTHTLPRQPRQRLWPWRRPRPHQRNRPMRPLPRDPPLPHTRRPPLHQRHERLRRLHVLLRGPGARFTDPAGV